MQLGTHTGSATSGYQFERRYRRALLSVPVTFHHLIAGGVRTSYGISLDICEGGIGALVKGGLQVGETVSIELALAGRAIKAVAIVRHTSSVSSGFEFVGLTAEERAHIVRIAGRS
jgi:PilZ domain